MLAKWQYIWIICIIIIRSIYVASISNTNNSWVFIEICRCMRTTCMFILEQVSLYKNGETISPFGQKKNTSMPKLQKIDRKKKGKYDVLVKIAFEKLVIWRACQSKIGVKDFILHQTLFILFVLIVYC